MTVAVALLAGFLPLSALADLVSIGALCAFTLVAIAVPILRKRRPDLERPFKVPFSPVLPIVTAVACLYLSLNLSVETWLRFLAWMLIGAVIYFGYGHRKNRLARREHSDTPEPAPTPEADPPKEGPLNARR
ncbi:amino acid permease C-terminal domain-containing protein [Micromonospora sp. BRA006-A]|nr:amino acid permease C-terminal domain-containing protein [Micromonospora sp. BRA006-A]